MKENSNAFASIDEYISSFATEVQVILKQLRDTIRAAAPDAKETISYKIPTFTFKGNLVHFAAWKNHVGFYPTSTGIDAFNDELSAYKKAKGSVQFPLDKPLPLELITKIVTFRVAENIKRHTKTKAKPSR